MKRTLFFLIIFTPIFQSFGQETKEATLTTIGTGKTLEEAKLNSYRNAIELAFGAFISSETKILNDNVTKDEVVSLTNGNISKVENIANVKEKDNTWASTNKVTVSVSNLSKFVENKGYVSNFDGASFSFNMKLMNLNERAEEKTVENIISMFDKILVNIFDYEIIVKEPVAAGNNYKIELLIKVKTNDNYDIAYNYLINSLKATSASVEEKKSYTKLGKYLQEVIVDDQKFLFRSKRSAGYLNAQLLKYGSERSGFNLLDNFIISDGIEYSDYFKIEGKNTSWDYRNELPEGRLKRGLIGTTNDDYSFGDKWLYPYNQDYCPSLFNKPCGGRGMGNEYIQYYAASSGTVIYERKFNLFYDLSTLSEIKKITIKTQEK
jgi:hypothetical protein